MRCIMCERDLSLPNADPDFCWWCAERFESILFSFIDSVESYLQAWLRVDKIVWGEEGPPIDVLRGEVASR